MPTTKRPTKLSIKDRPQLAGTAVLAEAEPLRAAIYCRISSDKAGDEVGVLRQEKDCRETCERRGFRVTEVYIDNSKSAWRRGVRRPGWDQMLADAQNNLIDVIVAWHPDRLMRQPRDLETLLDIARDHNIQLIGHVNSRDLSNPDDVFILRIEVAHACRSSDDTSRRVKRALASVAVAGGYHGAGNSFGYNPDCSINPEQADVVRELADRILSGASIRGLCTELMARGVLTTRGNKAWYPNTIRTMLQSPKIAGYRVHQGEIVAKGSWEPILSEPTWEALQVALAQRAPVMQTRTYEYLLGTVIRCSDCKRPMAGETVGGLPYYRCRRDAARGSCGGMRISAKPTEAFIVALALEVLSSTRIRERQQAALFADTAVRAKMQEIEGTLQELARRLGEGMPLAEYDLATAPLRKKLHELSMSKVTQQPSRAMRDLAGPHAAEHFELLTRAEKATVLRSVFEAVWVAPAKARANRFDEDRLEPVFHPAAA